MVFMPVTSHSPVKELVFVMTVTAKIRLSMALYMLAEAAVIAALAR